jgi:hypothetical protein
MIELRSVMPNKQRHLVNRASRLALDLVTMPARRPRCGTSCSRAPRCLQADPLRETRLIEEARTA